MEIRALRDEQQQVAELMLRLQTHTRGAYPARALLEPEFVGAAGLRTWLAQGGGLRLVAAQGQQICGYVHLRPLEETMTPEQQQYWLHAFRPALQSGQLVGLQPLAVIGRLGVDPRWQRGGLGRALLRTALASAWGQGLQAGLVVQQGLKKAQRLYRSEGALLCGSFQEREVPMRSYLFVEGGRRG